MKTLIKIVVVLFIVSFQSDSLLFGTEQEFPIGAQVAYSYKTSSECPTDPDRLDDVRQCGINILQTALPDILNSAHNYNIDIIYRGCWVLNHWNYGQYAYYVPHFHPRWPYEDEQFSHVNFVGIETDDYYASNGWAWYA